MTFIPNPIPDEVDSSFIELAPPKEREKGGEVPDLLAALQRSIDAARNAGAS